MYTEREKVRFVEMMWAEGLPPAAAHKKWGHPARETLRQWERMAEAGELPAEKPRVYGACSHDKHAPYPQETKAEAIRLFKQGVKPQYIRVRLGIANTSLIHTWVKNARESDMIDETGVKATSLKVDKPNVVKTVTKKKPTVSKEPSDAEVKELRAKLDEAELELAAYRELMRDPKSVSLTSLSKRQLVGLGEKLRQDYGYSLARILTSLNISKSTYLYHKSRLSDVRKKVLASLDIAVNSTFIDNGTTYGYRRISEALKAKGINAPERKVRASMKRQRLTARCSRAEKKWSSYAGEISDAPANLLIGEHGRHDFSAEAPNQKWLTDITEIKGSDAKVYLSVIRDCFDGHIASWKASRHPNAELANSTLQSAVALLKPDEHPIIHSDRGCHYRWEGWIEICKEASLVRSMSRKARSPDNAACEGFFGTAKVEQFHALVRSGATADELLSAIARYIQWYNCNRLKTFRENGKKISCETIMGRRKRLGLVI